MPRRNEPTQRMCIVTRQVQPVDDLLRFVAAPDGSVVADLKRNLPGRGVWVSAQASAVREAARRRLFGRGLNAEVTASQDLADTVADQLRRTALAAISMARKAGEAVSGFVKIEAAAGKGRVIALVNAANASEDGSRKLNAAVRRSAGDKPLPPDIRAFTAEQLGLAFSAPTVVHAALIAGPAGENALDRIADLIRFTGSDSVASPTAPARNPISIGDQQDR